MRHIILVLSLLLLLLALPVIAAAESYSCRDNRGRLHVADNLMSLPEECRQQAKTGTLTDSGRVNYVPPVPSRRVHDDFERAVDQEEQRSRARKRATEELMSQVEDLARSYENALVKRKAALRSREYGFRATIIQASQEMEQARKAKGVLLEKVRAAALTAPQRARLETLLDGIGD